MDILDIANHSRPAAGTPPAEPLAMPAQDFSILSRAPTRKGRHAFRWSTLIARLFVFFGTAAGAAYGIREISMVVEAGGTTILENCLIALFALTFTWIAFAACTAFAGFVAGLLPRARQPRRQPETGGRTAILVPVYNEDPQDVCARIEAIAGDLNAAGLATAARVPAIEVFVLSDTRDPDIWIREELAITRLRAAIGPAIPVWYRRRLDNPGRKAGNVADFVTRWGGRYDYMVVLDADSLMTAGAIHRLIAEIDAHPDTALVQTAPKLINATTLFARSQQFANQVYGPVFARGLACWQGSNGNFWGHNAIIRVAAFAEAAGLPGLKGKPPFGGPILSHDFVEAGLLRRRGWVVRMAPDIDGSFEEMPPTLSDVSVRDRRWLQGNLQHLRLIGASGLTMITRLHFLIGVMSYLTSPLWFLLILTGLALSVQAHFIRPEYFSDAASLFPMWPRFDTERMLNLLFVTLAVLFTPKTLGFIDTFVCSKRLTALPALVVGFVVETIFAALIAPIMMLIHSRHFLSVLAGRDSGWKAQTRSAAMSGWRKALRNHLAHMVIGLALALSAFVISTDIFLWMLPILAGLVFSVPLAIGSSRHLGMRTRALLFPDQVAEFDQSGKRLIARHRAALAERETDANEANQAAQSGLFRVLTDPSARNAHETFMEERPRVRGRPDPNAATATAKIADAESLGELISWLSRDEEVAILVDRTLLAHADRLEHGTGDLEPASRAI